jgi:hypothetical protein
MEHVRIDVLIARHNAVGGGSSAERVAERRHDSIGMVGYELLLLL